MATKSLEVQRKELEAKLATIKKQEAEIVEQKKKAIGEAVWSEMKANDEYMVRIMAMLEDKLTKNADRLLFGFSKKEKKLKTESDHKKGNG